MDFFCFSFLLCGYPLKRGGCHLLVAVKPWYKKKRTIYFAIPYPNFDLIINFDIQGIDKVFNSTLIDYLVNITYKKFKN